MNLSSVMVSKYLFRKKPLRLFRPEVSILTNMIVSEPNAIVVITTAEGEPTNKMDRNLTTDVTFNPLKLTCFLRGLLRWLIAGKYEGVNLAEFECPTLCIHSLLLLLISYFCTPRQNILYFCNRYKQVLIKQYRNSAVPF